MHYENDLDTRKRYNGDWKDGLYHGTGELFFNESSDVEYYKGDFDKGSFHNHGRLQYRDGGWYEGEFNALLSSVEEVGRQPHFPLTGKREGHGRRVWASGNTFEGRWAGDAMAEGRYVDAFNCSTYVGTFRQNKKNGSGKETWRSPHGKDFQDPCLGWKHAAYGVCKYKGNYSNGLFHGEGKFQAPDGRLYEGEWRNGKPHGRGTMLFLRQNEYGDSSRMNIGKYGSLYRPVKYTGDWEDGKRHGKGKLTYVDGSTKEVTFADGTGV